MILSLAAGPDDQVSLVQRLHHFLSLVKTDVVEVWVGDHTFYISYREKIQGVSVSKYVCVFSEQISPLGCLNQT